MSHLAAFCALALWWLFRIHSVPRLWASAPLYLLNYLAALALFISRYAAAICCVCLPPLALHKSGGNFPLVVLELPGVLAHGAVRAEERHAALRAGVIQAVFAPAIAEFPQKWIKLMACLFLRKFMRKLNLKKLACNSVTNLTTEDHVRIRAIKHSRDLLRREALLTLLLGQSL